MIRVSLVLAARRLRQPFNVVLAGALAILVVLVLGVAGIGHAHAARQERAAARAVEGPAGIAAASQEIQIDGSPVTLVMIWDRELTAAALDVAPSQLPSAGRTSLSEGLVALLDDTRAAARLEARLPGELEPGLPAELTLGPEEAVAFSVARPGTAPPDHVTGGHVGASNVRVSLAIVALLLLLPASSMVFMAARFDGRSRRRLVHELRSLGAKSRHLRIFAAVEAAVVAAVGSLAGWVVWQVVRPWIAASGIAGTVLHPLDLRLPAWSIAATGVAVVLVSVLAASRVVEGALTVGSADPADEDGSSRSRTTTRRAITTVLAGVAVLHLAVTFAPQLDDLQLGLLELTGLVLAVVGLLRLGPLLLGGIGGRMAGRRGGGVIALLAGRRLQFDGAQAFRATSGVVVIGFAFGGFAALDLSAPAHDHEHDASTGLHVVELNGHGGPPVREAIDAAGVPVAALAYRLVEHTSLVAIATCEDLVRGLAVDFGERGCVEGEAAATPEAPHRERGGVIDLGDEVPGLAAEVEITGEVGLSEHADVFDGIDAVIPVTADVLEAAEPTRLTAVVDTERERLALYAAVADRAPLALVGTLDELGRPSDSIETAATIGRFVLLGALLLAGAALALAAADAALRRRETSALLFAVGTPRRVRTRMATAEVALPLTVAIVPALLLGFEMVFVGGTIVGGDVQVPWDQLLVALAGTTVVAALATMLTIIAVRSLPTDAILRREH